MQKMGEQAGKIRRLICGEEAGTTSVTSVCSWVHQLADPLTRSASLKIQVAEQRKLPRNEINLLHTSLTSLPLALCAVTRQLELLKCGKDQDMSKLVSS